MRNEERYIPVPRYIIVAPGVDSLMKIRPQYRPEMARKNRPGALAAGIL